MRFSELQKLIIRHLKVLQLNSMVFEALLKGRDSK